MGNIINARKNLIGQDYLNWTVVGRAEDHVTPKGKIEPVWILECTKCKRQKEFIQSVIKRNKFKACNHKWIEIGAKYGKLTVIEDAKPCIDKRGRRSRQWKCKCDCGNEIILTKNQILYGKQHCGCQPTKHDKNVDDLTGRKFGRLSVIKLLDERKVTKTGPKTQWLCKCDCGNEKIVYSSDLKEGHVKSCGCLKAETASLIHRKHNKFDMQSFDFGMGFLSNGNQFLFDKEDYDIVKDFYWWEQAAGYIFTCTNGKYIGIHRIIMAQFLTDNDLVVDHINGDRKDNRKCNLRIATRQQNTMNQVVSKANTSGVTGVSFDNTRNKWISFIGFNRQYHSKHFDNFDDAVAYRKQLEDTYFGEYSRANSIELFNKNLSEVNTNGI